MEGLDQKTVQKTNSKAHVQSPVPHDPQLLDSDIIASVSTYMIPSSSSSSPQTSFRQLLIMQSRVNISAKMMLSLSSQCIDPFVCMVHIFLPLSKCILKVIPCQFYKHKDNQERLYESNVLYVYKLLMMQFSYFIGYLICVINIYWKDKWSCIVLYEKKML